MTMISSPEGTTLLSSMGWVDYDALWRFDADVEKADTIPLTSGASYSSLHCSGSSRFSVAHHFQGERFEVTLRNFSAPGEILARAVVQDGKRELLGDSSAWAGVPHLYRAHLGFAPWKDFVLVNMSPSNQEVGIQSLGWYDDSYDKGYQGVVDVLELPGEGCALVSVQRSSRLILHDLQTGLQRRSIDLGGRCGNPRLQLRDSGREIWASDYDTLVVLRREDWRILRRSRLQDALLGTQQFIGEFAFAPDEALCVVARPFSGDVVGIDVRSLKIKRFAKLGMQPLDVGALPGGEIVARDWKTGSLLRGRLRRRWFGRTM